MAFTQSWSLRAFSLFPGRAKPCRESAPLQMGSLFPENPPFRQHSLDTTTSIDRTSSGSSEGMDVEFDAVLLDCPEAPSLQQVLKTGPVSANREVKEWLEAAVFGEDEDFGALLVEPLRARVALGPIYDDIFGITAGDRNGNDGHDVSTKRGVNGDSAKAFGGQLGWPLKEDQLAGQSMHKPAERTHSEWGSGFGELAERGTPRAERIEHDMFDTVMGVVQSALQECQGPVSKQHHGVAGDSWAAIAGTFNNRAFSVTPKNPRKEVRTGPRYESRAGPAESFAHLDAQPGKGLRKMGGAQQGLTMEGCSSVQEWGPVKEERNPRLKAGKWKSHGRRKSSPPPRRMGNFGPGKFCNLCSPALSTRLQKRKEVRRECYAGELFPG